MEIKNVEKLERLAQFLKSLFEGTLREGEHTIKPILFRVNDVMRPLYKWDSYPLCSQRQHNKPVKETFFIFFHVERCLKICEEDSSTFLSFLWVHLSSNPSLSNFAMPSAPLWSYIMHLPRVSSSLKATGFFWEAPRSLTEKTRFYGFVGHWTNTQLLLIFTASAQSCG